MNNIITIYKKHKFPFWLYYILLMVYILTLFLFTYIVIKYGDYSPVDGLLTFYSIFLFFIFYPTLKYVTGQKDEYVENIKIFDNVLYFEYSKSRGKISSSKRIKIDQILDMSLSFETKPMSNSIENKTKLRAVLLNEEITIISESLGLPDYNMFLSLVKYFIKYDYFSYQILGIPYYSEKIKKKISKFNN